MKKLVQTLGPIVAVAGGVFALTRLYKRWNNQIIDHLDLQPEMNVLDVGCGTGRLTIPLAQRLGPTGKVVGIDVNAQRVQEAEVKAKEAGLQNIRFENIGAGQGKLPHNFFDRAMMVLVLGEVGEVQQRHHALAEIFQALKPGGILSITEAFLDPHFQPQSDIRLLADSIGFVEKQCYGNERIFTINLQKPNTLEVTSSTQD